MAITTRECWEEYCRRLTGKVPFEQFPTDPGLYAFIFERLEALRVSLELQAPNGRHVFERQLEQKQKELIAFGEANRRLSSDVDAKARTITGLGEINSDLGKQVLAEKGRVDAAEQNVLVLRRQLDEMCTNADRQRAENSKLAHELRAARTESEERGRRLREARGQLAILKGRLEDLITEVMNEISSPSKGEQKQPTTQHCGRCSVGIACGTAYVTDQYTCSCGATYKAYRNGDGYSWERTDHPQCVCGNNLPLPSARLTTFTCICNRRYENARAGGEPEGRWVQQL